MFLALALLGSPLLAQEYTKSGELVLPKDYTEWKFLSSSLGMSYPEEGPPSGRMLFNNVFVNPKAFAEFLKTGTWPDKTILMMENRESATKPSLNKGSLFQTGLVGIEAHVKDSAHDGWMFYAFGKDSQVGRPIAKTVNCYSCHEKTGAVDTTFVQYYPRLIDIAKQHGAYKQPPD